MPDLIVIFGPPAVGKAAVGHELARLTGLRFFHNYLTAEPVAALFGWGTERHATLTKKLRLMLFTEGLAQPHMPSIIFTFVWVFNLVDDGAFIKKTASWQRARSAEPLGAGMSRSGLQR